MMEASSTIKHVMDRLALTHPDVHLPEVIMQDSLCGYEHALLQRVGLRRPYCLVCDTHTWKALGQRLAEACRPEQTIILDAPYADTRQADRLQAQAMPDAQMIAVGSGTINDLCKLVSYRMASRYVVFPTAASMNGYISATASMTLESGVKASLPAHLPQGIFTDLDVSAKAPAYLIASGLGDTLARSTAQVDWWMSHRLLYTVYSDDPFDVLKETERALHARLDALAAGEIAAVGQLHELLTLGGLGMVMAGSSHPASMGEHLICHYIDCFAGERHPGTLHGQQIGVTSLTMAAMQQEMLCRMEPPRLRDLSVDADDLVARLGPDAAQECIRMMQKKRAMIGDVQETQQRLDAIWPELRVECQAMAVAPEVIRDALRKLGSPTNPQELGLETSFYREAVTHAREIRDRFTCLDLASGHDC